MNDYSDRPSVLAFPNARLVAEGYFSVPSLGAVMSNYIDISGQHDYGEFSVAKVSEPDFTLGKCDTIKLSRPISFQRNGEVSIVDSREGIAERVLSDNFDSGPVLRTDVSERQSDLNDALQLTQFKFKLNSGRKTRSNSQSRTSISFGGDMLVYCTAIHSEDDESTMWNNSFPPSYTSLTRILRPSEFAFGLGAEICRQIGPHGDKMPLKGSFFGYKSIEYNSISQMVLHGPVLYVDDPYDHIERAETKWERILAMVFLKSKVDRDRPDVCFEDQKEYRFALPMIPKDGTDHTLVPLSGLMKDSLRPMPATSIPLTDTMPDSFTQQASEKCDDTKTVVTGLKYTRVVTTSRTKKITAGDQDEEVVQTSVTKDEVLGDGILPDEHLSELLNPTGDENESKPDIIIVHQVGGRIRFTHEVKRNIEMEKWTIKQNKINEGENDERGRVLIPPEWKPDPRVVYDLPHGEPAPPEYILSMLFSPSLPRALIEYRSGNHFSSIEIDHALAFAQTVEFALNNVPQEDRQRAASAAWYAARLIGNVIEIFGAIVRNVSIIAPGMIVVELRQAPLSQSKGRIIITGNGTYIIEINKGDEQIITFPTAETQAFPVGSFQYEELLHTSGWHRKPGRVRNG